MKLARRHGASDRADQRQVQFCEVFFDNVRVPARNLVGGLNQGWGVAKKLLDHERAAMSKFTEGGAPSHDALAAAAPYLAEAGPVWRDRLAGVLMDGRPSR
jgi:acyl-CoA dehydrogenase